MSTSHNFIKLAALMISSLTFTACENNPNQASDSNNYESYSITTLQDSDGNIELVARDFDSNREISIGTLVGDPDNLTVSLNTSSETSGYESFVYISEDQSQILHFDYDQTGNSTPTRLIDISQGTLVCGLKSRTVSEKVRSSNFRPFNELNVDASSVVFETVPMSGDCSNSSDITSSVVDFTYSNRSIQNLTVETFETDTFTFIDPGFIDETFEELNDEGDLVTIRKVGQSFNISRIRGQQTIQLTGENRNLIWTASLPNNPSSFSVQQLSDRKILWQVGTDLYVSSIDDILENFIEQGDSLSSVDIGNLIFSVPVHSLVYDPSNFKIDSETATTFFTDGANVHAMNEDNQVDTVLTFPSDTSVDIKSLESNSVLVTTTRPLTEYQTSSVLIATKVSDTWVNQTKLNAQINTKIVSHVDDRQIFINICDATTLSFQAFYFADQDSQAQRYSDSIFLVSENIESSQREKTPYLINGQKDDNENTCTVSHPYLLAFDPNTNDGSTFLTDENGNILLENGQTVAMNFGTLNGVISQIPESAQRNSDGVFFESIILDDTSSPKTTQFLFDATLTYKDPTSVSAEEQRRQVKTFQAR